jgi:hypothetical protein
MVLPFVLPGSDNAVAHSHAAHAPSTLSDLPLHAGLTWPELPATILVTAAHTVGYLMATALLSLVVYHKVGLARLRSVWINLNLVWSVVLILSGILTWVL